jgi:L-alanine-DL-glutamate epimerase-like enolase superfamily enzyme
VRALTVKRLTVFPLALKMRRKVTHAASQRAVSEPIVVAIELMNGITGYGETLPRAYVTGETNATVIELLRGDFTKQLLAFRAQTLPEAWEQVEALPLLDESGHRCSAARAAVELALIDGLLRTTGRDLGDLAGWLGMPSFGAPGSLRQVRYGMVLASESLRSLRRTVRLARLARMRDFKLKVGFADDDARVRLVAGMLRRGLRSGRMTLRLDANAAWDLPTAVEALNRWRDVPIAGVEQPLSAGEDEALVELRRQTGAHIFHDESLVTLEDAERLAAIGVADGFNIRLSKCGGMMPALRLARFARQRDIAIQLGCMVGETSILSAAGVRYLGCVPGVRFCEGAFGGLLLAEDVTSRPVRFGIGGKPPRIAGEGLVGRVEEDLLRMHCVEEPIVVEL